MRFQLNITLTEDDYLAFNIFSSFESSHGKKQFRKNQFKLAATLVLIAVLGTLLLGRNVYSTTYAVSMGIFIPVYVFLCGIIIKRKAKTSIKQMKKRGKLPFEPVSKFEFYDDKLVEITPSTRTEQTYDVMERICIVRNQYILLYCSSVSAYILPIPQIEAQLNKDEFLSFLSQKCGTIEHY